MVKRALLVGINYPGTEAELQGCINDVINMKSCLIKWYGFAEEDMVMLIDTDPDCTQPTGANIRCELNNLVSLAEPGDYLYFHYSGHGMRAPANAGDDDDDTGYDECIYPCDSNLITDDDFRELVQKVPDGCKITIVSDSCHSGGLLENAKEQIGDSTTLNSEESNLESCGGIQYEPEAQMLEEQDDEGNPVKSRSLPLSSLIKILKEKSGRDDVDVGNIRPTLYHLFGKDASPKFQMFMNILFKQHQEGGNSNGNGHGGVMGFLSGISHSMHKLKDGEEDKVGVENEAEPSTGSTKNLPINGVMVSGCQSHQTSVDLGAYGACTNALLQIIEESEGQVTNRDIVLSMRMRLAEQGLSQQPGLYCSDEHLDSPFIC